MSVTVNPKIQMRLSETIAVDGAGNHTFEYTEFDRETGRYDANSTPAATKVVVDKLALTGGAATIDLTSLTGPNGAAVTFNGLKVLLVKWYVPTTNSGASIVIDKGASNGYELNGSDAITVHKGCHAFQEFAGNLGAVGGSAKTLDITGTGTDQLWYEIVAGS